ncbi:MAG: glycosyltransferase, partial [Planctomycetota bacterium]
MDHADDQPTTAKPRRIAVVTSVFIHPDRQGGGVSQASRDMAVTMARRGHTVEVVAPLGDLYKFHDRPDTDTFFDGRLKFHYLQGAGGSRLGAKRGNLAEVLPPVLGRCELMHLHTFLSPFSDLACRLAIKRGVPFFVSDHGKFTPSMLDHRGGLKKLYLKLFGTKLLRQAAAVLPLASPLLKAVRGIDPGINAAVVSNGLDPAQYDTPADKLPRPIESP